jgi:hypothetical protein
MVSSLKTLWLTKRVITHYILWNLTVHSSPPSGILPEGGWIQVTLLKSYGLSIHFIVVLGCFSWIVPTYFLFHIPSTSASSDYPSNWWKLQVVLNFVHFPCNYISYTVCNILKSGIYHSILLAYCICRWHLSCGIFFITHLEFWIALYSRCEDWWLFYLPPGLTFTDSTFSLQIAFTFFYRNCLPIQPWLTVFYNRRMCLLRGTNWI